MLSRSAQHTHRATRQARGRRPPSSRCERPGQECSVAQGHPTVHMGLIARIADGAMARTAWNADLWSAQRPAGPRAVHRRPISRDAGTGHPTVREVCHSNVRITPNAGVSAEIKPPRNGGSVPPPPAAGCAGRRPAFQAVPAVFRTEVHAETGRVRPAARLRRAVPAGGRRSKPSPPSSVPRSTPRRELSRRSGFVPPPAYGGLCRSEDRRSKPSPRSRSVSDARFPLSPVTCAAAGYPPAVQPAGRAVEPDVHLPGAHGVLVLPRTADPGRSSPRRPQRLTAIR